MVVKNSMSCSTMTSKLSQFYSNVFSSKYVEIVLKFVYLYVLSNNKCEFQNLLYNFEKVRAKLKIM